MPAAKPFKKICLFQGEFDRRQYFLERHDYTTSHSASRTKCLVCNSNGHKSKVTYGKCSNAPCYENGILCKKEHKFLTCLKVDDIKHQKVLYSSMGAHNSTEIVKKGRGISE